MHSIRSILSALVILCVNTANWPVAAAPHIACRAECGSLAIDDAGDFVIAANGDAMEMMS